MAFCPGQLVGRSTSSVPVQVEKSSCLLAVNPSHMPWAVVPSQIHCCLQARLSKRMSHRTEALTLPHALSVWISLLCFSVWQQQSNVKGVSTAWKEIQAAGLLWVCVHVGSPLCIPCGSSTQYIFPIMVLYIQSVLNAKSKVSGYTVEELRADSYGAVFSICIKPICIYMYQIYMYQTSFAQGRP